MSDPRRKNKMEKAGRRGAQPRQTEVEEEVAESTSESVEVTSELEEGPSPAEIIESLEKERDEQLDRFQRLAAEFDNYRKRQARDFNRLIEQGRKKLIEELITVLDNFDRARQICQGDHSDKEIVDGIMQTSDQLRSILQKEGLEDVETNPGDHFDPNIHEAMVAEDIEEGETDIVLEVYQKGYFFGKDLLRPARVKVGRVSSKNGG